MRAISGKRMRAGALLGAFIFGAVGTGLVMQVMADVMAEEKGAGAGTVTPAFAYDLPNLPGQTVTGVLVEYPPGAASPPHHHTEKGSVVAYVLEGAVRSKVNEEPERVYQAGESWLEPPGAAHSVSENASTSEPARLLAIFVAERGAELTTFDE
jgi:quercetin dioxygenase-like cupin family protein